ncbi:Concanavalin A-like lectin/glucanases superfamily [uncultured Caudovirales phage]|uniref:Concanavalin A-like lectin/glucanases superfamily n=1 Tax=uncultured Caudovirales phage TaxID=2100421 RepID=A0A6J5PB46_9CAUD|nr:Concanavalin A-like lectin/glucanases superfamily [uncultured Caudovirales phage]CAB4168457.1 Concanavalin A-like lectin/glucanases superfamily [uncultured Caudovirales phage]CAB4196472.1 Concanavalin A-like lectin/glucanases superfamily [uncultured Caudovirales phage]CAB4205326.1 Concanavalin A-like lectin/glucanases superfamily [uncultured Caudovirales phage]
MVFNSSMLMAGATANASGYSITNSARFVSGNSAYLTRTPGAASNRTTYTLSTWVKRGALSVSQMLFQAGTASQFYVQLTAADKISINSIDGAGTVALLTTQVFRDVGAWYHVVIAVDTNNATAANRVRLYVNGLEVTAFDTRNNPGSGATGNWNNNVVHNFGRLNAGSDYADCYVANVTHIDGSQLTPSSFGQTNTFGVWTPKAYSGTYGTNGFLMEFKNSAALGTDTSGKGNTFTSSGLTSADCMSDTPTLNYCTLNPLIKNNTTGSIVLTYSNGNLRAVGSAANGTLFLFGTMPFSSGKYRMEATVTNLVEAVACGIVPVSKVNTVPNADHLANGITQYFAYTLDGKVYNNNSNVKTNTASSLVDGELIAVEADITSGQLEWFHKDSGVWVSRGTYTFTPSGDYVFGIQINDNGCDVSANFGQQGFDGTPTSGFGALNSSNLPAPAIKDGSAHFQTALHTGTGSAITINQSGNSTFTPDFVWTKGRSGATDHILSNVISGTGKYLVSDTTAAEVTNAQALTAFGAGSISYGTMAAVNTNAATYVDWMWKGGGAGVSNTSGSITSTVSTNTTAGISIVTYTGTGANATVGHGLGVAPQFIIVKGRSFADQWPVWHTALGSALLRLDLQTTTGSQSNTITWNNTGPTSTVFSVGTQAQTNTNGGTLVAYCFAPIAGFSAFGSYTGNASADGPFIYTGFKPAWVMWKNASAAATSWLIKDTSRDTYNVMTTRLFAENTNADDVNTSNDLIDYVSNGFKVRSASGAQTNGSGNTIIYAAFASNPFGGSGAAPATAR